jgi:hypothetical protein
MAKTSVVSNFKTKTKNKLRRHKKHKNKHKSTKPYKGQG